VEPLSVETLEVLRMIDNFGYPGLLAVAAIWVSRVGKKACEHIQNLDLGPITLDVNLRLAESEIDELQRKLNEAEERLLVKKED
jgi:hypothetical protein